MSRKPAQLKFRLPRPLHKRVRTSAKQRQVSLNSELIRRVEQSFDFESIQQAVNAALSKAEPSR